MNGLNLDAPKVDTNTKLRTYDPNSQILSSEILAHIFSFLKNDIGLSFSRLTCRYWYDIVKEHRDYILKDPITLTILPTILKVIRAQQILIAADALQLPKVSEPYDECLFFLAKGYAVLGCQKLAQERLNGMKNLINRVFYERQFYACQFQSYPQLLTEEKFADLRKDCFNLIYFNRDDFLNTYLELFYIALNNNISLAKTIIEPLLTNSLVKDKQSNKACYAYVKCASKIDQINALTFAQRIPDNYYRGKALIAIYKRDLNNNKLFNEINILLSEDYKSEKLKRNLKQILLKSGILEGAKVIAVPSCLIDSSDSNIGIQWPAGELPTPHQTMKALLQLIKCSKKQPNFIPGILKIIDNAESTYSIPNLLDLARCFIQPSVNNILKILEKYHYFTYILGSLSTDHKVIQRIQTINKHYECENDRYDKKINLANYLVSFPNLENLRRIKAIAGTMESSEPDFCNRMTIVALSTYVINTIQYPSKIRHFYRLSLMHPNEIIPLIVPQVLCSGIDLSSRRISSS